MIQGKRRDEVAVYSHVKSNLSYVNHFIPVLPLVVIRVVIKLTSQSEYIHFVRGGTSDVG